MALPHTFMAINAACDYNTNYYESANYGVVNNSLEWRAHWMGQANVISSSGPSAYYA